MLNSNLKRLAAVSFLVWSVSWMAYVSITSAAQATTVTVSTPSGAGTDVVGESEDYFTQVLGDPRDMQEHTDLIWQELGISNISVSGGIWSGTATNSGGNSRIWPLFPGFTQGGVAEIGKIGWNYPIQASKYKQLSFRLNAPASGAWQAGYTLISHTQEAGFTSGSYSAGWQVYTSTFSWGSGSVYGLFHRFIAAGAYQFDWIRLTDPATSPVYTITFTVGAAQAGDVVDLTCYTSTAISNANFCGRIATGIPVDAGGTFNTSWRTAYLAPGQYYVYAEVKRGGSAVASDLSDGALTIKAAPIVRIDAPSMTSGPDYATTVLGNPWDMNGPTDLKLVGGGWTIHDLSECSPGATPPTPCFSNGELHATTGRLDPGDPPNFSDPFVYLNVSTSAPIDTGKYKYLTYRYKIDRSPWWENSTDRLGDSPPGSGIYRASWLARLIFFTDPLPDLNSANETNDLIAFDDWNTYQMDLSQGQARGYWEPDQPQTGGYWIGFKTWLRFDFLEGIDPWTIHLDDVKLTGGDTADASFTVRWSLPGGRVPARINFYAHQNPAACGSGSPIFTWPPLPAPPLPITGTNLIYLPLVQLNNDPAGDSFNWNTSGVPAGAYTVCAVAEDGYNVTRWVSETPVIISH
ncbi:MAG: hypothetical protein ACRDGG_03590 [Anaerolineae bacterium]